MPNLKQLPDGSTGLEGRDAGPGPIMTAGTEWIATSVDKAFFVAPRSMAVQFIKARVDTVGSDAGAVTATIRKVPSGTALASGTVLHTGTVNLKGAASANQLLTLSTTASVLMLAAGDALAIDFTGTMTAAAGCVTVGLTPA